LKIAPRASTRSRGLRIIYDRASIRFFTQRERFCLASARCSTSRMRITLVFPPIAFRICAPACDGAVSGMAVMSYSSATEGTSRPSTNDVHRSSSADGAGQPTTRTAFSFPDAAWSCSETSLTALAHPTLSRNSANHRRVFTAWANRRRELTGAVLPKVDRMSMQHSRFERRFSTLNWRGSLSVYPATFSTGPVKVSGSCVSLRTDTFLEI
jgi:hypothetical protein